MTHSPGPITTILRSEALTDREIAQYCETGQREALIRAQEAACSLLKAINRELKTPSRWSRT